MKARTTAVARKIWTTSSYEPVNRAVWQDRLMGTNPVLFVPKYEPYFQTCTFLGTILTTQRFVAGNESSVTDHPRSPKGAGSLFVRFSWPTLLNHQDQIGSASF